MCGIGASHPSLLRSLTCCQTEQRNNGATDLRRHVLTELWTYESTDAQPQTRKSCH